ncbi:MULTISPECIES: hypothetical protein [Exiguobacterium]|uniref:hypothetical protein n=1 Tax=Exiguobacterium TaxID=33986 RepID=UPI001305474D|nr:MULTISPECIES: hypothetical protein [Exiguobacterium]
MINKSTRSILHGLTNGTDVERRAEADDLGIDDGRAIRFMLVNKQRPVDDGSLSVYTWA